MTIKTARRETIDTIMRNAKERAGYNPDWHGALTMWSMTAEELAKEVLRLRDNIRYQKSLISEHERTVRSIRKDVTNDFKAQLAALIASLGKK